MNSLWDILSVAIGISFIFMLLSILNSWIQDYIANVFQLRAKNLADIVQNLLEPGAEKLNGKKRALEDLFPVFQDNRVPEKKSRKNTNGQPTAPDGPTGLHEYTVRNSRPIHQIAKRVRLSLEELQAANPHVTLDKLPLPDGFTLKIPYPSRSSTPDMLTTIAKEFEVSPAALQLLPDGFQIKIPYHAQASAEDKATLRTIAETFKVPVETLQKENPEVTLDKLPLPQGFKLNLPQAGIRQMENRNQREVLFKLRENPVKTLYAHPVIFSLSKPNQLPDRLPTNEFTVALLDLLDDAGREKEKSASDVIDMKYIQKGIEELEKEERKVLEQTEEQNRWLGIFPLTLGQKYPRRLAFRLRALLYSAQINAKGKPVGIEAFQNAVSEWFDDTVARGSVWYKRRMQRLGIICGFLLAIVLNADTFGLSNALWHNAMLRESVLQAAQTSANQTQLASGEQAQQQLNTLTNLGLPIGWSFSLDPLDPRSLPFTPGGWIAKIAGLLLTGFAISQGSQIWFDLMNRLLNVRASNLQPPSEEGAAKDKSKKE